MDHHKISLINRRNQLFDTYLDILDKIKVWEQNGSNRSTCKLGHSRDHVRKVIQLMKNELCKTSMKLRVLDAEITGIRVKADDNHTIEEIN